MCSATKIPVSLFGSRGFIGGVLMRGLSRYDHLDVQGFSSQDADFARADQLHALAGRIPPTSVWVIAAARSPDWSGPAGPGAIANFAMAENFAGLIGKAYPRQVIFLSSVDVYGRTGVSNPISEKSPFRPESDYAISKTGSELTFQEVCGKLGLPLTILRLPGVYGPGDTHHGPVRNFMDAALQNREAVLHGDGEQLRDLVYVEDLPRLVAAVCERPKNSLFNVVSGRSVTLNTILRIIEDVSARRISIVYKDAPSQVNLVFKSPTRLKRQLRFNLTPIETGIAETHKAMTERKERP